MTFFSTHQATRTIKLNCRLCFSGWETQIWRSTWQNASSGQTMSATLDSDSLQMESYRAPTSWKLSETQNPRLRFMKWDSSWDFAISSGLMSGTLLQLQLRFTNSLPKRQVGQKDLYRQMVWRPSTLSNRIFALNPWWHIQEKIVRTHWLLMLVPVTRRHLED